MTYKSILVPIDGSEESERRIGVAARLAADFHAHLVALAIVAPLELPQRLRSHPGVNKILKVEFEKALGAARALAKSFPARAREAGAPSAEARLAEADPIEAIQAAARSADLVVVSQPEPDDIGALGTHFLEKIILESGRPVLLVPRKGSVKHVGRRVLVAWKDAAASSRALSDARPLLAKADSITVLAINEDGHKPRADEAVEYLARHGLKARGEQVRAEDAGRAIVSQARKMGADLVVMGAFARTRLTEMILGGATRTVLQKMGSCVLMSH